MMRNLSAAVVAFASMRGSPFGAAILTGLFGIATERVIIFCLSCCTRRLVTGICASTFKIETVHRASSGT